MIFSQSYWSTIVFLSLWIRVIESQSDCQTIITANGTQNPERCVFPFKFEDKTYFSCTAEYDPKQEPWCSVEVDSDSNHVVGKQRWGHCDLRTCNVFQTRSDVKGSSSGTIYESKICRTVGGPRPNRICQLPFEYKGKTFYDCTTQDSPNELKWCSTFVDTNGTHIGDNWGHCECSDGRQLLNKESECSVVPIYERIDEDPNIGYDLSPIGADYTNTTDYPFAVLIGANRRGYVENITRYICGGTLITRRHVLTAGHCYLPNVYIYKEVLLGDNDIAYDPDCLFSHRWYCSGPPQKIGIEKFIIHPDYDRQTDLHDIAIVKMVHDARLSDSVQPVCLAYPSDQNLPSSLRSVGWGRTDPDSPGLLDIAGAASSYLLKVDLPLRNVSDCLSYWPRVQDEFQICAGAPGKGSCLGDSGGPLLVHSIIDLRPHENASLDSYTQVGIVSYGSPDCGSDEPAVYTRISAYRRWIENNLIL